MVANVAFNPLATTTAASSFNSTSSGRIQGQSDPDPATLYQLAAGILASTETVPMWGGVAISEAVPTPPTNGNGPVTNLGGSIIRATSVAAPSGATAVGAITGFSVFDQNYSAINFPQSPVPLVGSGGQVNFYRLGSNRRIAVACSAGLGTLLDGNLITSQVSWDYTAQELVPYNAAWAANTITAATYSSVTNKITLTTNTNHGVAVGAVFDITGVVATGATGGGTYNGTFTAVTGTATNSLVAIYNPPNAGNPGTYSSGGALPAGGGALPCKVLDIQIGNGMTVSYNATTGFATWNYNGNIALIQI